MSSSFEEMGKAFVGFYYPAFSENRGAGSKLDAIYTYVMIYDSYARIFF